MKVIVLSNLWYPWPGANMVLSLIFRREEPDIIILNGDTTYCKREQECPHVYDVIEIIRSSAPWAELVYIIGDNDPYAYHCIRRNHALRREVTVSEDYVIETYNERYVITHGHQSAPDILRKKLGLGPWDWLVLGHSGKLEENKLTRIIHIGGLGLYTPPALQGYLLINDLSHRLKKL